MEGTPFGRYRLVELLGRGGMGEVWRAQDTATNNRAVAIKLLPPHLADDESFVRRFRREADAAARLNSPHVIPIHDYGEIDGRLFVNMRLVEGKDLAQVLGEGPLGPARTVHVIEQVAKALHAAHRIGLLHRDVKPSNVLLDEDDFAYLIDFGIARAADQTRMTGTGNMIGTLQYMAPERLREQPDDDARADEYALACVLYECLTGRPPFDITGVGSILAAHLSSPPPRPSAARPEVSVAFDAVVAKGMAKDPNQRYATTVELSAAAREALTGPKHGPAHGPRRQPPMPVWTPPVTAVPPLAPGGRVVTPPLLRYRPSDELPQAGPPWAPGPTRGTSSSGRRSLQVTAGVLAALAVVSVTALIVLWNGRADSGAASPSTVISTEVVPTSVPGTRAPTTSATTAVPSGAPDDKLIFDAIEVGSPYLFVNGQPRFEITKVTQAEDGWYVAYIKLRDDVTDTALVALRQDNPPSGPMTVVAGPGTAFPPSPNNPYPVSVSRILEAN